MRSCFCLPSTGSVGRTLEGHAPGHRELDQSTGPGVAADAQTGPDPRRALAHAGQAAVSLARRVEDLGVDAAPVVANGEAQAARRIFDLDGDGPRAGVPERVQ